MRDRRAGASPWRPDLVVLTCEHAGNAVPDEYRPLFAGRTRVLRTHRAWDPGALELARRLGAELDAPVHAVTVTRLLVDVNRSLDNRTLLSEFSRRLDEPARRRLIRTFYSPHRRAVEDRIGRAVRSGKRVLHVSVHTFTPVYRQRPRRVEIGLLLDPARPSEVEICDAWRAALVRALPKTRIVRNQPYRGTTDGFTAYLRTRFAPKMYAGVELEVSSRLATGPGAGRIRDAAARTLASVIAPGRADRATRARS